MTALPRRLGRYELFHELARGGMGVVYLARHRSVGGFSRLVAVKQCLPEHTRDRDFVAMFLDEARLAARVRHPSVVPTIDVEHDRDVLFLAMEYIEGERLIDLVRAACEQTGAVPLAIALRVMIDSLRGLHAAHSLEDSDGTPLALVHRDVSPQNIIVGYDGLARIIDFGVARAERRLTRTMVGGLPKGKLAYMAPEQVLEQSLDRRADVFAAGLVAWEVLTGRRLFDANVETALVAQVLEGPIVAPSSAREDVPPAIDRVVLTALDRDASKRFQTALEFAEALERAGTTPASQDTVARFATHVLADKRAQRLALQRRIEAMPPLPDASAQRSATASPVPKTVAFDPSTHAPSAPWPPHAQHAGPAPAAVASSFGATPSTYGSNYGASYGASRGAYATPARESTSPLAYVAVGMVVIGVAFGAASVVARSRARNERTALAPIEVPVAVAVLPTTGSDTPVAPAQPSLPDAGGASASEDSGVRSRVAPQRRRPRRPNPPEGVEF